MKTDRGLNGLLRRGLLMLTLLLSPALATAADAETGMLRVYVGTYTNGDSQGIYTFEFDPATGKATEPQLAAQTANPSFVAPHPDRNLLIAVNEVGDFEGASNAGGITSFQMSSDGTLKAINSRSTRGGFPCHLSVDKTGNFVLAANYGGGSVICYPINDDGSIGEAASFHQHSGSSANPRRQEGPHAHSVNLSADNRHAVVADLGVDKLLVYEFNADTGELTANDPPAFSASPGAGPRHFSFHPDGKYAYTNNELTSSVTALKYDPESGSFTEITTLSTLPDGFSGNNSTAETRVHPNGKFVYVSNRGHDSIAIFAVGDDGSLSAVGHESTQGKTPRNFELDPSGQFLFAANQGSNTIVLFRVDAETGELEATGDVLKVGSPVCVKMFPVNAAQ